VTCRLAKYKSVPDSSITSGLIHLVANKVVTIGNDCKEPSWTSKSQVIVAGVDVVIMSADFVTLSTVNGLEDFDLAGALIGFRGCCNFRATWKQNCYRYRII
jgi:hypothetical protein